MTDRRKLHFDRFVFWHKAGLLVCRRDDVISFGDLNPEVSFHYALTRWERFRVALWFLWAALDWRGKADE